MTTNADLHQRYQAIPPSYVKPLYAEPISIERGQGSYVWDVEGNALRITPMLDVADEETDEGVTAILETIEEIDRQV